MKFIGFVPRGPFNSSPEISLFSGILGSQVTSFSGESMKFHMVTEGPHVLRRGPGLWGFSLKIEVSAVKKSLNLDFME